eukprot:3369589-Rhodomonas_salina.1
MLIWVTGMVDLTPVEPDSARMVSIADSVLGFCRNAFEGRGFRTQDKRGRRDKTVEARRARERE